MQWMFFFSRWHKKAHITWAPSCYYDCKKTADYRKRSFNWVAIIVIILPA